MYFFKLIFITISLCFLGENYAETILTINHNAIDAASNELAYLQSYDKIFNKYNVWQQIKSFIQDHIKEYEIFTATTIINISKELEDFKLIAESRKHNATRKLDNIKNKYEFDLNAIIKQAANVGNNITACIKENRNDIQQKITNMVSIIGDCVNEKVNEAKLVVQNVKNIVDKSKDLSKFIKDSLNMCRDITKVLNCLTEIKTKILNYIIDVSKSIIEIVQNTKSGMNKLKGAITDCAEDNIERTAIIVLKEIRIITKCVLNKSFKQLN